MLARFTIAQLLCLVFWFQQLVVWLALLLRDNIRKHLFGQGCLQGQNKNPGMDLVDYQPEPWKIQARSSKRPRNSIQPFTVLHITVTQTILT